MAHNIPNGTDIILEHMQSQLEEYFNPQQAQYFLEILAMQPPDEPETPVTSLILHEIMTGTPLPIRPLVILDETCMTGRVLMAYARQFPRWAIVHGFILFYGYDEDPILKKIAEVNCLFNGIEVCMLSDEDFADGAQTIILKPDLAFRYVRPDEQ
jgi:hypothetical protein